MGTAPEGGGSGSGGGGTSPTTVTSAEAHSGTEAVSGTTAEATIAPIPVDILEFDDKLFHDGSCVMMPEIPAPEGDADEDDDEAPWTGVKAVALGIMFAALYPEKGMLVTGHTASVDNVPESFRISRERAEVVLHLFRGNGGRWATTCAGRHTIKDIKYLLKYVQGLTADWKMTDWECDPGEVNDTWDADTKDALNNFVVGFNAEFADADAGRPELPAALGDALDGTDSHLLSTANWRCLYQLYNRMICDAVGWTTVELTEHRTSDLRWVNDTVKMVGCAHTYAVPEGERADDERALDKIRSRTEARVEVLFYQAAEAESQALAACPTMPTNALHDLEETCPLWHDRHFQRYYVSPNDRFAVVYHLKFRYYDQIKKDFQDIPGRFNIKAWQRNTAAGSDPEEIPCITQYLNGMHTVRVRFSEEAPDFSSKDLYFGFEIENKCVFTESAEANPRFADWEPQPDPEAPDPPTPLTFEEKYKRYRLPAKWFSFNWWTFYDTATPPSGERFQTVIKEADKRHLKPYGGNTTTPDEPLTFSLDDIVLIDATGSHDQNIQDEDQLGHAKALCHNVAAGNPGSRVKLFYVDEEGGTPTKELKLYEKTSGDPKSCRIRFDKNLISEPVKGTRIVHFRDGFYTVSIERTADEPNTWMDAAHKPVVGARIALRDDPGRHKTWGFNYNQAPESYTGDYHLHYFHRLHLDGSHPVSFVIVYLSINFILDTRSDPTSGAWTGDAANPRAADVTRFADEGVYNAIEYWNRKRYWFEEEAGGDDCFLLKRFYFFDERETFTLTEANVPKNINFRNTPANVFNSGENANVEAAKTAAFGGPVMFFAFVCPNDKDGTGAETDYGSAWAWGIRGDNIGGKVCQHSAMLLNKAAYHRVNNVFPYNNAPGYSEDGTRYGVFTMAHELGHCTSLSDEYVKTEAVMGWSCPTFAQFWEPFTMTKNQAAMMYQNGAPRIHNTWYHLRWINHQINGHDLDGDDWLGGKTFVGKFTGRGGLTYKRSTGWQPPNAPATSNTEVQDDIRTPMVRDQQYDVPNFVEVSETPAIPAPLQAKVEHIAADNKLLWKDAAAMTDPEKTTLRGLFTQVANKDKVDVLQQKTQSRRRLYMALYDVGKDEASFGNGTHSGFFHNNQNTEYQAILVVRVMAFIDGDGTAADWLYDAGGASGVNGVAGATNTFNLRQSWERLGATYRLVGGADERTAGFERIFVHFLPGFKGTAGDDNYHLTYHDDAQEHAVTVSAAPVLTGGATLPAGVTYHGGSHELRCEGKMTTAARDAARNLFAADADKAQVTALHDKSKSLARLTSPGGNMAWHTDATADEIVQHFINRREGEAELDALWFLQRWLNEKMGPDLSYTIQAI